MAYEAPRNILSPESLVVEFKPTPRQGFFTLPHSDDVPGGWGKPYEDQDGNPIPPPGTPNGLNPVKFLYWDNKETKWIVEREPGSQVYGNIDWLGKYTTTPHDSRRRVRLSYWGPQSRYFSDPNFIYGSEQKHNDIYQNGKYLSIAPLPVLGAAVTEFDGVDYLIVICKDGLSDQLYIRELPDTTTPSRMDDDLRASKMALFDEENNPDGWVPMGRQEQRKSSGRISQQATTPWFFNMSGNEAQCLRDVEITFDNGVESGVVELGLDRFKCNVTSAVLANFTYMGNTLGFTHTVIADKGSEPHITVHTNNDSGDTACVNEYTIITKFDTTTRVDAGVSPDHYMSVDHITETMTITGTYTTGVDYVDDSEVLLQVEYDCSRSWKKWWRQCIDLDIDPNYDTGNYLDNSANGDFWSHWSWWDTNGDLIETLQNAFDDAGGEAAYWAGGGEYPPAGPEDGRAAYWQGSRHEVYLKWTHPKYGQGILPLHTWNRNYEEELGFMRHHYLHFLDIRPEAGYVSAVYTDVNEITTGGYIPPSQAGGGGYNDATTWTYHTTYKQENNTNAEANVEPIAYMEVRVNDYTSTITGVDIPGNRCEMLSWNPTGAIPSPHKPDAGDFTRNNFYWTYATTQYTCSFPDEQKYIDANYEPTPHQLFGKTSEGLRPWPKWRDLLSNGVECKREGGIAHSGPDSILTIKYTDAFNNVAYYNYITNGDLNSMVIGAERYYPVGAN